MAIFIYILIAIALWHFIFESILAPAIRMHLRNQLFALRDELRWAWIEDDDKDDKAYVYMQDFLNNAIHYLHVINISFIYAVERELSNNAGLARNSKSRRNLILNSKKDVFHKIDQRAATIIGLAVITNVGGWLYLVVPLILFILTYARINRLIEIALSFPDKDARRLPPFGCGGAATA